MKLQTKWDASCCTICGVKIGRRTVESSDGVRVFKKSSRIIGRCFVHGEPGMPGVPNKKNAKLV